VGFRQINCLNCQQRFQPRSGRQERCDNCRSVVTAPLPDGSPHAEKPCAKCSEMFTPVNNAQKNCEECRNKTTIVEKSCGSCGKMFTPVTQQKWCDECRASDVERCSCGSPISGRARWGNQWGGGCDRSEERVVRLMRLQQSQTSQ